MYSKLIKIKNEIKPINNIIFYTFSCLTKFNPQYRGDTQFLLINQHCLFVRKYAIFCRY